MMSKKETVYSREQNECFPDSLLDFQDWLKGKIDLVPEEYLSKSFIKIDAESFYDCPKLLVDIFYMRPETEEEAGVRNMQHAERERKIEMAERKKLKELMDKYTDRGDAIK